MGQLQVTGILRDKSGANRRAAVRYHCPPATAGKLFFPQDQEFQRAWVTDLSVTGVGLLMARPLSVGSFLVIILKSPSNAKTFELPAHIVRSAMQPSSGDWVVGCEFITRLSQDDLDSLLD